MTASEVRKVPLKMRNAHLHVCKGCGVAQAQSVTAELAEGACSWQCAP